MKQKDIVFLLISSVILTLAWIIFTIIHKGISSTIAPVTSEQITAIKPDFDNKTISELVRRHNGAPAFSLSTPSSSTSAEETLQPTPTVISQTPTPIPTGPVSLITQTPNINENQASTGGNTQ